MDKKRVKKGKKRVKKEHKKRVKKENKKRAKKEQKNKRPDLTQCAIRPWEKRCQK